MADYNSADKMIGNGARIDTIHSVSDEACVRCANDFKCFSRKRESLDRQVTTFGLSREELVPGTCSAFELHFDSQRASLISVRVESSRAFSTPASTLFHVNRSADKCPAWYPS